ncbi:hypothetical protein COOONC_16011 [Cooperia oncophora]
MFAYDNITLDLAAEPYNMTSSGFGRKMVIAEIGGPGNLFPTIHKEKEFDLKEICESCEAPSSFVFGPGAGPWKVVGRNCEMVADANFTSSKVGLVIFLVLESFIDTSNVLLMQLFVELEKKLFCLLLARRRE